MQSPSTSDDPAANASPSTTTLLAAMHPANFAIVMATGIVGIGCHRLGLNLPASVLLWTNLLICPALWLLLILRLIRHADRVCDDVQDAQRSAGFFAMAAGVCVLGAQWLDMGYPTAFAWGLWLLGLITTLLWTYGLFFLLTVASRKQSLDQAIHGGWLVAVVAGQATANLGAQLATHTTSAATAIAFVCLMLWLVSIALYVGLILLILQRWLFHPMTAIDMTPAYWINMGAAAISALAGLSVSTLADHVSFVAATQPFILGLTLLLWGVASWWIPMLLLLGVWRYLHQRTPLRYHPLYWSAVFPLGMYTVCTLAVAMRFELPPLRIISLVVFPAAALAWLTSAAGLCHHLCTTRHHRTA